MDNQKRHAPSENSVRRQEAAEQHRVHRAAQKKPASKAKGSGAMNAFSRLLSGITGSFSSLLKRFPGWKAVFAAIGRFFSGLCSTLSRLIGKLPVDKSVLAGFAALVVMLLLLYVIMVPSRPDMVADAPLTAPAPTATVLPEPSATPEASAEPLSTPTPEPTSTPEPSAVPVSAAAPTVTMIPTYKTLKGIPNTDRALGLPKCEQVDHSYFNDTVFIGDSVSEKLHLYVTKMRRTYPELLGNAKFITTPSLSSRNALKPVSETSLHPTIRGKKMPIEDAVALSGAKKVYVMLGMNDVGVTGVNQSVKDLFTLLRKIKDKSPDIQIFVQSATPRMKGDKPTTEQLFKYNLKVYEYCRKYTDYDIYFVDVAYAMRNKYGNLTSKYCSDPNSMAIHFTDAGCKKWIQFLYTHALV